MKRLAVVLFLALASFAHAAAIAITAANVLPSANAIYLPGDHYALSTITAGQWVYRLSTVITPSGTTPDIGLASASGAGDATKVIGVAVESVSAGQPVKVVIRDSNFSLGGTAAAGDVIYLHTTAGSCTSTYGDLTTGNFVCVLGVGIGGNVINIGGTLFQGTASGTKYVGVIRADAPK